MVAPQGSAPSSSAASHQLPHPHPGLWPPSSLAWITYSNSLQICVLQSHPLTVVHGPICNENLTMLLPCLEPPSAPFPRKEPQKSTTEPCLPRQCHLLPAHCPADEQDVSC